MAEQGFQDQRIQKEQYWQAEIKKWQQSGMTQAGYCRRLGLKIKTFSYWVRKLRRQQAVQFVELPAEKLRTCNHPVKRTVDLKLIIDDRFSIEVREGFNRNTLKEVIETVRQL